MGEQANDMDDPGLHSRLRLEWRHDHDSRFRVNARLAAEEAVAWRNRRFRCNTLQCLCRVRAAG